MKVDQLERLQGPIFKNFVQTLEAGRLNHAYLFSGDFASMDMALFLSKALFCQNKKGALPCEECRSCRLIEEEEFADVTIVRPQNQVIKTDRVRELVRSFSQSGVESSRQVFIISQADKMHTNAANSLLKVMEEPQSEIYLFLLTADAEKVLPTIRSRAQLITFPKNQAYLEVQYQEMGLLLNQAQALASLTANPEEGGALLEDGFVELHAAAKRFAKIYLEGTDQALLEASRLALLANDKAKQGQVFDLLEGIWCRNLEDSRVVLALEKIHEARLYWQANVSFQASLEFTCLT